MLVAVGGYLSIRNNSEYGVFSPVVTTEESNEYKKEPVPFTEEKQDDANLPSGATEVRREGVNGVKTLTYHVTFKGNVEISRTLVKEEITTPPVSRMVAVGTRTYQPPAPSYSGSSNNGSSQSGPKTYFGPNGGITTCYPLFGGSLNNCI